MDEIAFILFIIVVLFGCGIAGFIIALVNRSKIRDLESRLDNYKNRLVTLQDFFAAASSAKARREDEEGSREAPDAAEPPLAPMPAAAQAADPAQTPAASHAADPAPVPAANLSSAQSTAASTQAAALTAYSAAKGSKAAWADTLSTHFARYWTGILGSLALVIGFAFLGILTALRFSALPRIAMIVASACILLIVAQVLRKKNKDQTVKPSWRINLAAWLRAAGGALILFSAMASSSVPGLQWIESEFHGYILLFIAITLNVWLSIRSPSQAQLSFHSLICLAALAIAPPSTISLIAALSASFITSLPAARRGWNWHLIIAEAAFFAFTFIWRTGPLPVYPPLMEGSALRIEGLLSLGALALAILPILLIAWLPGSRLGGRNALIARGLAWAILAAGIFSFSAESRLFAPLFLLFSLCAWICPLLLSRLKRPEWLRVLDTLASLALGLIASFSLIRFEPDMLIVLTVAFFFVAALSLDKRNTPLIVLVCDIAIAGLSAFCALYFFKEMIEPLSPRKPYEALPSLELWAPGLFLSLAVIILALCLWFSKKELKRRITALALMGLIIIARIFPTGGLYLVSSQAWILAGPLSSVLVLILIALLIFFPRIRRHFTYLNAGSISLCIASLTTLIPLITMGSKNFTLPVRSLWALGLILSALIPFIYARLEQKPLPNWLLIGVALLGALIPPVLIYSPGIAWPVIALSLYTLGLKIVSIKIKNQSARTALGITSFALQIFTCILLAPLNGWIRQLFTTSFYNYDTWSKYASPATLIALLSLSSHIFILAKGFSRTIALRTSAGFAVFFILGRTLQNEAFLLFTSLALLILGASRAWRAALKHPRFALITRYPRLADSESLALKLASHTYWLWLGSMVSLFLVLFTYESLDLLTFIPAMACALGYTLLALLPRAFDREGTWSSRFLRWPSRFFLWPLFAVSLAGVLGSDYSGILSILLFTQSLVIFALGMIFRDRLSRPVSWSILILGFLRIFFVDLAQADTLGRALVFIIAGISLLAMNFLYNRFSGEKKEGNKKD